MHLKLKARDASSIVENGDGLGITLAWIRVKSYTMSFETQHENLLGENTILK
jgi:hypothetical protein